MIPELKDMRRIVLTIVAFIAGAVVPVQIITPSFGYVGMVRGVPQAEMIHTIHKFARQHFLALEDRGWLIPFLLPGEAPEAETRQSSGQSKFKSNH